MAKTRGAYPPEFRRQMVELVHAGRTPEALAHEFEPTAQSIRNWVAQWERNAGHGDGGLTTAEREELSRLRWENRQLRLERERYDVSLYRRLFRDHDASPGYRRYGFRDRPQNQ
jgi:transposase